MKLGVRIFACYLVIFVICFSWPLHWMLDTLRTRYLEGVEDPLVDQANILASIIGLEMKENRFDRQKLFEAFQQTYARSFTAKIYDLTKNHVDMGMYITDTEGKIIFDAKTPSEWGKDYSSWRDVQLTLNGEYGARSTDVTPDDPASAVLYVAAPIMVNGEITGVLTVAKPTTNINGFLKRAKPRIYKVGSLAAMAAVLLSLIVSVGITRPIKRITQYADDVRAGKRSPLPKLGRSEIGVLGDTIEKMREALEGKKYAEQYVQTLTHEIKSPLSAIRGAAELLEEEMPLKRRDRFLANIRNEAGRIQQIVDRLLELASLESRTILKEKEKMAFKPLVKTVLESKQPIINQKKLRVENNVVDRQFVTGDTFLLYQAISNLIQNAIDFSPSHSQITLASDTKDRTLWFTVEDQGTSIPSYAREKVFDKFFSLQRPDSGKKSTGLGLNLVKEVAELHNGDIKLTNRLEKGVRATLRLPLS
jgi:two-component system sensor histidine kinase CreC